MPPPMKLGPFETLYLYLRSRDPAIYSRLEVYGAFGKADFCQVSVNTEVNPYGERNLEREPNLPFDVMKPLKDEARNALRAKKLPLKPDLPKLIKEAKEKAAQEEDKP